jgi:hypothetical protein
MSRIPTTRIDHGPHETPASSISQQDLARYNAEHDQRYRWSQQFSSIYFNPPAGHVIGPPGLSKLKSILNTESLDALVHEWHNRDVTIAEHQP